MQGDDDHFIYSQLPSEKVIVAVKRVLKEHRFNSINRLDRNEILKMILTDHGVPAGPHSSVAAATGQDETIDQYMRIMIRTYYRDIIHHRRVARRTREELEKEEEWSPPDYDNSGSRLNTKLQRDIRQMERVGAMVDRKLMKLRREEARLSNHL